jgi:hypothetical protein
MYNTERIENNAQDVYTSMMELESDLINNKKLIRELSYLDDANKQSEAMLRFSANIFLLLVKRFKHGLFQKDEFEKGKKLEELIELNSEAIGHKISASALKAAMNTTLYQISLDDTFMELLKDYAEYLKPIFSEVI